MRVLAGQRMKAFHHHLSSGDHRRAAAALALLAAIASRGPVPAAELARGFDFDLKALAKLARPPRWEHVLAGVVLQSPFVAGIGRSAASIRSVHAL